MSLKGLKKNAALDEGAPPDAREEALAAVESPVVPAAVQAVPRSAAPSVAEPAADDLSSVAPEGLPVAPAAPRATVAAPSADKVDLEDAVRVELAKLGTDVPSPARTMPAPPRAPVFARVEGGEPSPSDEAGHDDGVTSLLAEPQGIDGAPVPEGEPKPPVDPEDPEEQLRRANAADAIMSLLSASGEPDAVTRQIARDYVELLGDTFTPRKRELDARQAAEDIEAKRRAALEAGRQANAGRGGAISSLVGTMLGMGRNRRSNALAGDVEAYNRDYNRTAGDFRDRIYAHRLGQFTEGLTHVRSEASVLKDAVVDYNEAFMDAPAAAPAAEAFESWARREGMTPKQASRAMREGKAPAEVTEAIAAVREAVLADPDVAIRRETMLKAEDRFAERARKSAADAEILSKNFHDRDFDAAEARDKFCEGLQQAVKDIPDPIGEEESRQKMKERMRELVEGIRRAFDAVLDAVARLVTRSSAPAA